MGEVRLWSASSLKVDRLATDRGMYAGIQLSSIPSMCHPTTAASSDDLWQLRMPEYLQGLEAVSKNIGLPVMGRSAVKPGDNSSFRNLHHAADLGVGAPLQVGQVVKAGKSPIVSSKRPPAGAKLEREKACRLIVASTG
jgi:hypothetical protein